MISYDNVYGAEPRQRPIRRSASPNESSRRRPSASNLAHGAPLDLLGCSCALTTMPFWLACHESAYEIHARSAERIQSRSAKQTQLRSAKRIHLGRFRDRQKRLEIGNRIHPGSGSGASAGRGERGAGTLRTKEAWTGNERVRTDMHRPQELVRLHRLGLTERRTAKELRMRRNTAMPGSS